MPNVFWSLTFFELSSLMKGKANISNENWSAVRYISATILNSRMGVQKKDWIDPDDLKPKPKSSVVKKKDFVDTVESMKKVVPFNIA